MLHFRFQVFYLSNSLLCRCSFHSSYDLFELYVWNVAAIESIGKFKPLCGPGFKTLLSLSELYLMLFAQLIGALLFLYLIITFT